MSKPKIKPNNNNGHCKIPRKTNHKLTAIFSALLAAAQLFTGSLYIDPSHSFAAQLPDPKEIVELTNTYRNQNGGSTLAESPILNQVANAKLTDMQNSHYWAHVSPVGTQPWAFFEQAGYNYSHAGENLGKGFSTAQGVVNGWISSPKHRENLINKNYTEIGVAVGTALIEGKTTTVMVQMFGTPKISSGQTSNKSSTVMGTKSEPNLDLLNPVNNGKLPYFVIWGILFCLIVFDGIEIRRCGLHLDKKKMFEFRSALLINCFAFALLFVNIVALG